MADNKITFGLEQVHIAFRDPNEAAPPEYDAPIAIPGAVRFTPSVEGEEVKFYADNIPYYVVSSNNGYTAELEMALVPDAVLAEMLGWDIDDNGMLVEVADGEPTHFALMGQVLGDQKNRRFVYYDCIAARPAKEHATKGETIEPAADVLSLTILPIAISGTSVVKGVIELGETNESAYNGFFTEVLLPDGTPAVIDKAALTALLAFAATLDEVDYTVGTWATFASALSAATTVKNDAGATQGEVNGATATLQAAILALVPA